MQEFAKRLCDAAVRPPELSKAQILAWADLHQARFKEWPIRKSGPVHGALGETWKNIDAALFNGRRSLPGGSSLAQLLQEERGVRNFMRLELFSENAIIGWAKGHFERTGNWPTVDSGSIDEAQGETWERVNSALRLGMRGLPGGSSLASLLGKRRPRVLTLDQIREWIVRHYHEKGKWPGQTSGPIDGAPGESWKGIDSALGRGRRGLPNGFTLAKLVAEFRAPKLS